MMRQAVPVAWIGVALLGVCGCIPFEADWAHVGKPCELESEAGPSQAVANNLVLSCDSHLCLKPAQSPDKAILDPPTGALCSDDCTADIDCESAVSRDPKNPADHRCKSGFVCAMPFETGPFCCRRLCACRDFLASSGGDSAPVPVACSDPASLATCAQRTSASMPRVGQQTVFSLDVASPSACLNDRLVDLDATTADIEPDCRASYRLPLMSGNQVVAYRESSSLIPMCSPGASPDDVATDCWRIDRDANACSSTGQLASLVRPSGAATLETGTVFVLRCWTCASLTSSPGCDG